VTVRVLCIHEWTAAFRHELRMRWQRQCRKCGAWQSVSVQTREGLRHGERLKIPRLRRPIGIPWRYERDP